MSLLFAKHFGLYIFFILVLSLGAWFAFHFYFANGETTLESTIIKTGDVTNTVTASGKIEVKQISRLGFSVTGTIQQVYKNAGDTVAEGDVIASLTNSTLIAEYDVARQQVAYFTQIKKQLENGPTTEEKRVATTNVSSAEIALDNVKTDSEQAIKNAYQNILSTDLVAYPRGSANSDIPPTISGNYLCNNEGSYILSIYPSSSYSGYSYFLSGLESGTFEANTNTPAKLGECGLYILFSAEETYRRDDWIINIPNQRSTSYITLKNTYDLLVTQQKTTTKAAKEALQLAKDNQQLLLSPATPEALAQAEANLETAKARLAASEARIADYTIRAPFSGLVTNVNMKVGEPASPAHTVTIIYDGLYNLKARVPEVDITKVKVGNDVSVTFDADAKETFPANIDFISPLSSEVGGVAYYDTYLILKNVPPWLREGLNADIVITSEAKYNVPTLPKRFIVTNPSGSYVLIKDGNIVRRTPIKLGLIGTNGLVEILDLPIGSEVLLP